MERKPRDWSMLDALPKVMIYENPQCRDCRSRDLLFSTDEAGGEHKRCQACGKEYLIRGIIPVDERHRILVVPTRWGNGVYCPEYFGGDYWRLILNVWSATPYRMHTLERAREVIEAHQAGSEEHSRWWDWCREHPTSGGSNASIF